MKMTIQVVIEDEEHHMPPLVKEVFSLERKSEDLRPETFGLSLAEAKNMLAEIQTMLVRHVSCSRTLAAQIAGCPIRKMAPTSSPFGRYLARSNWRVSASTPARATRPKRGGKGKSRSVSAPSHNCCQSGQRQSLPICRPNGPPS